LAQDRVAECFGRDAGAVGDIEDGAVGHGCCCFESRRKGSELTRRIVANYSRRPMPPALLPQESRNGEHVPEPRVLEAPVSQHHGVSPCLNRASSRPPWSYRLST